MTARPQAYAAHVLTAEVTLPGRTLSVQTARRFVDSVLTSWGFTDLGWTATVVTSELATNCALHAPGSPFTVRVQRRGDGAVRLEVSDSSVRVPLQRGHSTTSTTGRGLRIVSDLAQSWGVDSRLDGKTVWVELTEPDDPRSRTDAQDDVEVDLDALLASLGDGDGPAARVRAGHRLAA